MSRGEPLFPLSVAFQGSMTTHNDQEKASNMPY